MTRTEGRLTDALAARAAAVAADSIRPLPVPQAGPLRRHLAGRRWSVSLAPIAAAAAIVTITSVVGMLPHHHAPRPKLTGMPTDSALFSVTAVSASDAWAVGLVASGRRFLPLIMHWNGTAWSRSRTNLIASARTQVLFGVAAASARDAWAVGYRADKPGGMRPSILHWNGAQWTSVPTPRLPAAAQLTSVAVVSATDAWAVGEANGALILHWNGVRWRIVPGPRLRGNPRLNDVYARSADDVWAVGATGSGFLILHWDGVSWTRLAGPKTGPGSTIYGVAAVSRRLTWLVGRAAYAQPLILRWNGSTVRRQPAPRLAAGGLLAGAAAVSPGAAAVSPGAAAVSPGQAWAAGTGASSARGENTRTLMFRWQGRGWVRVPSPAGRVTGILRGLFALSAKNVWAVGYTNRAIRTGSAGFILHWNGTAWQAAA